MGIFERYLSLWVGLCIIAGVTLGNFIPEQFALIASLEWAHVNLVVAVLIWVMIYPMMVQIDFSAIKGVGKKPKGLILTLVINWLIKPFSMAALGWLFFKVFFADLVDPQSANEYIAGMILLGVAPCTAMVFVWMTEIMKHITPYSLIMAINLEPIYSIILALVIFGDSELMSNSFYVGSSVIIGIVFLEGYLKNKQ